MGIAEYGDEFIGNTNTVVVHAGTNNLSDGESIDTVIEQYIKL